MTRLPIGAREGFVLSRVDGGTTLAEIAALTGFPIDEVERIFARLIELRAAYVGAEPPWTPPPPQVESKQASEPASPGEAAAPPKPAAQKRRPRRFQPADLDEPAELDRELKERILDAFTWLDDLDHYELLGVPRDADRKAIKSAYYALAATFHTDRHFGKQLGSFKSKMEQIFGRITQAHDTLANRQRRAEYDAYLVDRDRTKAFERYLSGEDAFEDEPAASEQAPGSIPPEPAPPEPETGPPAAANGAPTVEAARDDEKRLRREALARRLAGASSGRFRTAAAAPVASASVAPRPSASSPVAPQPASPPTAEQAQAATEAIRRRYEEGREHARHVQARRLIEAADEAMRSDDLVSAANQLRLAIRYTDDPAVVARYEDVNRRARDLMAETYLKQARYEEQQSKWQAAALSYVKAHEGRPDDGTICERAANALRMEGRDLHKAARFAELAVQKNPSSAAFRVTLGAVYLDAGLFLRARSELEHAAKLDSGDATIKDLLARARKMAS